MNHETLNQFTEQMTKLLESGAAFAGKELPVVFQEILDYYFWFHTFWVVAMSLCLVALYVAGILFLTSERYDSDTKLFVGIMVGVLGGSSCLIALIVNTICIIQIFVAPRLYLIEYFTGLVKGS